MFIHLVLPYSDGTGSFNVFLNERIYMAQGRRNIGLLLGLLHVGTYQSLLVYCSYLGSFQTG